MNDTKKKHELWVKYFLSDEQWEPFLIFGYYKGRVANIKPLVKSLKTAERLDKSLKLIAKKIKLSNSDKYSISLKYGLPNPLLTKKFIELYVENKSFVGHLKSQIKEQKKLNKNKKSGPSGIPTFIAKNILIALCIHKNCNEGLKLVKNFIEPKGDLEKWLIKSKKENFTQGLVSSTGDEDIKSWAYTKRQTLERIILSNNLNKNIKSFMKHPNELRKLRNSVENDASNILDLN